MINLIYIFSYISFILYNRYSLFSSSEDSPSGGARGEGQALLLFDRVDPRKEI